MSTDPFAGLAEKLARLSSWQETQHSEHPRGRAERMSRLMSVTLTEQAVRDRVKTVTRRLGWRFLKPGDRLTLCSKVQGRRRPDGAVEPLERLAEVEVVSVRREWLEDMPLDDLAREGFPEWTAIRQFVEFFCEHMRCSPNTEVTRIEWRYLDGDDAR